jgi:cell division control protein 6
VITTPSPDSTRQFEQIINRLTRNEEVLVVAFGDINYLCYENEASHTLYSILRTQETYPGAKIGVTAISPA